MNRILRSVMIAVVVAAAVALFNAFFVLPEGQQVVITQFGRPVGKPITQAGLQFKIPFIQDVTFFDKRILIWDGDPNQVPTNDKTFVYLDVTARWRISNALVFLQAVNNEQRAQTILDDIIDGTVRDLVNKNDLVEIIRSSDWDPEAMGFGPVGEDEKIKFGRDKITALIHANASKVTPKYGIELVDVMFKRVNYIDTVQQRVYERMISERKRIAAEKRSTGEGLKSEILGKLERELREVSSLAVRESQKIKGKADGEAAKIYADAYNQDPEFYAFSKSMDAYRLTMGENTRLVLSPDSPFYRYLKTIK
ncbi:protease modulator HflC [Thiovibrio frasassiensis]|uniref:Protein HflC n=1 Tax=Thiovibrio frasassiensis TaxID=2984131 RepID=A0A9X4MEA2_9BACT|nr:protease modulator HflC [Thiovibrio frasassiensis]MDG4474745.1 protease modulator HflC [Thiovibrio frasassiensis]